MATIALQSRPEIYPPRTLPEEPFAPWHPSPRRYIGQHRAVSMTRVQRAWAAVTGMILSALLIGCSGGSPEEPRINLDPPDSVELPVSAGDASAEELFIAVLETENLVTSNSVELGRSVCGMLDTGSDKLDVLALLMNAGFEPYDAGFFLGAATGTLCPEHVGAVA